MHKDAKIEEKNQLITKRENVCEKILSVFDLNSDY